MFVIPSTSLYVEVRLIKVTTPWTNIRRHSTRLGRPDYCCVVHQTVNRKCVVLWCFARFQANLGKLRLLQDIWVKNNNDFLTI